MLAGSDRFGFCGGELFATRIQRGDAENAEAAQRKAERKEVRWQLGHAPQYCSVIRRK